MIDHFISSQKNMQHIYLTFLIILSFFIAKAQEGFIQAYDLGYKGMGFMDMIILEDKATLILFGTAKSPEIEQWGVLWVKMDTLGNVLAHQLHHDAGGDHYVLNQGGEIIATTDGGYAMVGQLFYRNSGFIMKLDAYGALEFVQEYPDEDARNHVHTNIVELEQGYLCVGGKQQEDYLRDGYVLYVNKQGDKIWDFHYGTEGVNDHLRSIIPLSNNEILITGSSGNSSLFETNLLNLSGRAVALTIDTMGNILSEYIGDLYFTKDSINSFGNIRRTSDGNWVNTSVDAAVITSQYIYKRGEIVKRDTAFNVIWRSRFGEATSIFNTLIDVTETPDKGFVTCGLYAVSDFYGDPSYYMASWLTKLGKKGQVLWSRNDTLSYDPIFFHTDPYLSGVVALPSGSIIAAGNYIDTDPSFRSQGWVIKVDKDGCIIPGCNPTTSSTNIAALVEDFSIYPNPTTSQITIEGQGDFEVQVYDAKGQLIFAPKMIHQGGQIALDHYPAGMYFVKIHQDHKILTKKVIKND